MLKRYKIDAADQEKKDLELRGIWFVVSLLLNRLFLLFLAV